jgi:hypothetical protein
MNRNYRNEYDSYHKRPEQKKNRAKRNAARALMIKKKGAGAVSGKDVHHKDRNPQNNSVSNLSIANKSKNRSRK